MTKIEDFRLKWMADADYRARYAKLANAFDIARALFKGRISAGLMQEEVAKRIKTTQSVIARPEDSKGNSSTKALEKFAEATGKTLQVRLV